ncbi:MAG TPA: glycosyltransferase family 4 protein [Miltoncostaeaceae bacterium]|nr:glycosyltransferase family 4 protein [Miltoncostaeaceae bacterium]
MSDLQREAAATTRSGRRHGDLRILLVSDYYPPFIGGVQRQIQLLGRELTGRGHEVRVATIWSPGSAAEEWDGPVRVHRVRQMRSVMGPLTRPGKHHPPPFPDPVCVAGLRRIVRRMSPDVVHAYGWIAYSCAAALVGTGVPLVVSARDYAYGCPTRTLLHEGRLCSGPAPVKCLRCAAGYYGTAKGITAAGGVKLFRRPLTRRIAGLHSISTFVRDVVRRDFLDDRVRGLPHAVVPSFMADEDLTAEETPDLAARLAALPDEPFIMFVGALRREKGIIPLLGAYARLRDAPPLVLIGTREPDTPPFPPGVHVLTDFPHRAVLAAWRRALFGVIPSLWPEPLGSVVYEGMSAGKAVVGTTPGGHIDMIEDGATGRLVRGGDVDGLRAAMQQLIDDPMFRETMGRAAATRARDFTAAVVIPRLERLYRSVM